MTATATIAVSRAPSFESDFTISGDFALEAGGVLHSPTLHYALYGKPNAAHDNVVFVPHALSGSARVADWWQALFTHASFLDPEDDCILGINFLGSCYGSTGPSSLNPKTGKPYALDFPLVTIRDIVRAQALLLDHLGVAKLKLALGASIGGMQAIEWAIQFPQRISRAISIGAAPLSAMGLAMNHLQRETIRLDAAWANGRYDLDDPPSLGMALARALAVCTYKSPELFSERFAREPNRNGEDPYRQSVGAGLVGERFDVAGYLDHQGRKFNERFDPNSYLAITRTMDTFDPARDYPTAHDAFSRIRAEVTLVGISSDWLFPPADIRRLAEHMSAAGVACKYREMISAHGHDAFLAEPDQLFALLRDAS